MCTGSDCIYLFIIISSKSFYYFCDLILIYYLEQLVAGSLWSDAIPSLIMISVYCCHLLCPFIGGLLVSSFYFSVSTSVISLIKKAEIPKFKGRIRNGSIKTVLRSLRYFIFRVNSWNCSKDIQYFNIYWFWSCI